jgi:hypothetical protein
MLGMPQACSRAVLAVALLALTPACAGRKAAWQSEQQAPAATPGAEPEADVGAQAEAAWGKRGDPAQVRAAIQAWEEVVARAPNDAGTLAKLTRAHYFLAEAHLRKDDAAYLETMDRAVSAGERAILAASPEFAAKMRDGAKFHEAIAVVPAAGVPALYWYASALGRWAKKKGFAVLLGQKDNVKAAMDRCLKLEPTYYQAGPYRYFGAFYAVAPSFAGGDLAKSKEHFLKALELSSFVGTKVLWAAELATKEQDEATFTRLLQEVLASPDDAIPEMAPEIAVEKAKARELLAQQQELF